MRPPAYNPSIHPELSAQNVAQVLQKQATVLALLQAVTKEFMGKISFAHSLGAEDMVLFDIIARHHLDIQVFSLDTGRLPAETYSLIEQAEAHYSQYGKGKKITLFFPQAQAVETYVNTHGINAFYQSLELRKTCCGLRKLEPLKRALQGQKAWVTGLRASQSSTRTTLQVREHDSQFGLEKINPLHDWSEQEVWVYIQHQQVPYNALHEQFYPSIGCAPCTRAISLGEDVRAGRWWWEETNSKECGLHQK